MNILWPPPYYLLRDRIPVFLTVIYLQRHQITLKYRNLMGWGLMAVTVGGLFTAFFAWIMNNGDMTPIFGFKWSIPSPIEWSLLVIFSSMMLYQRGVELFKAYYIALLSGLGGGWIYEILYGMPYWVRSGFAPWNLFKLNANKVLYFEFQVICLPLVMYLISRMEYKRNRLLLPTATLSLFFYLNNIWIAKYIHKISFYTFQWVYRVPSIITLYILLDGVKGEKK